MIYLARVASQRRKPPFVSWAPEGVLSIPPKKPIPLAHCWKPTRLQTVLIRSWL